MSSRDTAGDVVEAELMRWFRVADDKPARAVSSGETPTQARSAAHALSASSRQNMEVKSTRLMAPMTAPSKVSTRVGESLLTRPVLHAFRANRELPLYIPLLDCQVAHRRVSVADIGNIAVVTLDCSEITFEAYLEQRNAGAQFHISFGHGLPRRTCKGKHRSSCK